MTTKPILPMYYGNSYVILSLVFQVIKKHENLQMALQKRKSRFNNSVLN